MPLGHPPRATLLASAPVIILAEPAGQSETLDGRVWFAGVTRLILHRQCSKVQCQMPLLRKGGSLRSTQEMQIFAVHQRCSAVWMSHDSPGRPLLHWPAGPDVSQSNARRRPQQPCSCAMTSQACENCRCM